MSIIGELKLIDGFFDDDSFFMRGINGYAIHHVYKAEGIRSLGRRIGKKSVTLRLDEKNTLHIPKELNEQLAKELFMIADELEGI